MKSNVLYNKSLQEKDLLLMNVTVKKFSIKTFSRQNFLVCDEVQ